MEAHFSSCWQGPAAGIHYRDPQHGPHSSATRVLCVSSEVLTQGLASLLFAAFLVEKRSAIIYIRETALGMC